jgi:hypothetical protein
MTSNTYVTNFSGKNVYHDVFYYSGSGHYFFVTSKIYATPKNVQTSQPLYFTRMDTYGAPVIENGLKTFSVTYAPDTYKYILQADSTVNVYKNGVLTYTWNTITVDGVVYPVAYENFPAMHTGEIRFPEGSSYFYDTQAELMPKAYEKYIALTNFITAQYQPIVDPSKKRVLEIQTNQKYQEMLYNNLKNSNEFEKSELEYDLAVQFPSDIELYTSEIKAISLEILELVKQRQLRKDDFNSLNA